MVLWYTCWTATVRNILTDFNNALVWMVSSRPLTSKPSIPFTNPLVTVPSALITIGITVTFMLHSLFNSLTRPRYLSFCWLSILICGQPGLQNPQFDKLSFSYWILLSLVVWLRFGIRFYLKIPEEFVHLIFHSGLCIYDLFTRTNFNYYYHYY